MASFVGDDLLGSVHARVDLKQTYNAEAVFNGIPALNGNVMAVNSKWIAYPEKDGFCLTILDRALPPRRSASPRKREPWHHGQSIKDFGFNPFDHDQVMTVAPDGYMKLWKIPEGGCVGNELTSPAGTWKSKDSTALRGFQWHPSLARLVMSRSSRKIMLWDLNADTELVSSDEAIFAGGDISSTSLSYDGSVIYAHAKDKRIRILDLRLSSGRQVVATAQGHEGIRHSATAHLGSSPYFCTTGHGGGTSAKTRQLALWDSRKLEEGTNPLSSSIQVLDVDDGPSYGSQLVPLFDGGGDQGSGLLYLVGKGESLLSVYAFDGEGGAFRPVLEKWNQPMEGGSCLGAAFFPRSDGSLNYSDNEVGRVLQASASSMRVVSIKGLREGGGKPKGCCEAWYGSTTEGAGPNEDVSVEAFMGTGISPTPRRVAIDTSVSLISRESNANDDANTTTNRLSTCGSGGGGRSSSTKVAGGHMELDAEARIRQVVEEEERMGLERVSSAASRLRGSSVETLRYKYMRCDEAKLKDCSTDIRVNSNPLLGDCPLVAAGKRYWALPWEGTGGSVFLAQHDAPAKVPPAPLSLLRAHNVALGDLSFSPFHDDILATAGADACLRLWKIPPHLNELSSYTTSNALFTATLDSPVQSLVWHPTVGGVVASTTHENAIYMHSFEGKEIFKRRIACKSNSSINNASFNPTGGLLALGCKDDAIRVLDPRAPSGDMRSPESTKIGRNLRVVWCSDSIGAADCLMSVAAKGTNRHVEIWDPRKLDAPLSSLRMDSGAGQLYPYYDQGMQTAFIVGRGDTTLRTYEFKFETGACMSAAKSSEYATATTGQTWAGMAMLPKSTCNISSVQCARMLKLTSNNLMVPLSFVLPRSDTQKGLFQDDIFPDIPSDRPQHARSLADFQAYLSGEKSAEDVLAPNMLSLRPSDMKSASEAEEERRRSSGGRSSTSTINTYKMARIREEQEKAVKDDNFTKLQALAKRRAANHPNLSMGAEEVDSDDNWSDED